MKKKMMLALAMGCLVSVPVYADYKEAVREDVRKELGAFFQRNEGNRITVDVIDGLALHLIKVFDMNKIEKDAPDITKVPDTPKIPSIPGMPKKPEMPKGMGDK